MLMAEGFTDLLTFTLPLQLLCCSDRDLSMHCEGKQNEKQGRDMYRRIASSVIKRHPPSSSLLHPPGLISCGAAGNP